MSTIPGYEFLQTLQVPELISTSIPTENAPYYAPHDERPLDNAVHPLFEFKNWLDITWAQYEALLPAFRVASLLLEQEPVIQWFGHTLLGDLKKCERGYVLVPNTTVDEKDTNHHVANILTYLSTILRLSFHPLTHANTPLHLDGLALSSSTSWTHFLHHGTITAETFVDPRIYLHSQHLWAIEHLVETNAPADELELTWLRVAITLCHELAHVVWKFRARRDLTRVGEGWIREPLHCFTDTTTELGNSLESYLFGGNLWSIDHPSHMLAYHTPSTQIPSSQVNTRIIVPRWWIHMWFSKVLYTPSIFTSLHRSNALKLPSAEESGYVLRQDPRSLKWNLYVHGAKRDVCCCVLGDQAPYLMWTVIRPMVLGLEIEKKDVFDVSRCECRGLEDGFERLNIQDCPSPMVVSPSRPMTTLVAARQTSSMANEH